MIYPRTHTRDLDELSLLDLSRALPFAAFAFVIASAASMGIPGFSGFAAEITILIGAWLVYPMAVDPGHRHGAGGGVYFARAERSLLCR